MGSSDCKHELRSLPAMDCLLGMPDMDPFWKTWAGKVKTVLSGH